MVKKNEDRMSFRANVIDSVRKLSLLDATVHINRFNTGKLGLSGVNENEEIKLEEVFAEASQFELEDARIRAMALLKSSGTLVDLITRDVPHDKVKNKLEEEHPGFGDDSYSLVLVRAQYMAIK